MKKQILLIGGAGYIGAVLTGHLLSKGYVVKSLDALIYSQHKSKDFYSKNKNYKFIFGDIRNELLVEDSLKQVDDVVILAGLVGDPITKKYPKEAKAINYFAIKNLIKQCTNKNLGKVIFISTCSNYGIIKNEDKADENYNLNPLSIYAKYKVEIENYILSLKNQIDFSPTILRFATAFGLSPRMRFDLTINHFTKEIVEGKRLEIYDPHTWRPYCHVIDFARLIESVILSDQSKTHFEIFNAGSDENNYTKKQIFEEIAKIIPTKKFTFIKGDNDPRNYRVNFSKVKKMLNFNSKYSIQHGIKEIYDAIRSNRLLNESFNINELGNFKIAK